MQPSGPSLLLLAVATSAGAALLRAPLPPHDAGRMHPTLCTRRASPITATTTVAAPSEEAALISLLSGSGTDGRGASLTAADAAEVHRLASSLEASVPPGIDTNDSPLLPGRWRVLYQGKAGTEVSALSLESWRKYAAGDGPSPIQNLVSGSSGVNRLYQSLQLDPATGTGRFANVIDFSPAGVLAIDAVLEGKLAPSRLGFRFKGGTVLLRTLWNGTLSLPYPVPFALLGDNAKGWLQTNYLSPTLRLSRGNKGSLFVLVPEPEPDDAELEALLQLPPPPPPLPPPEALTKQPVLICPAQFGTASDYAELSSALSAAGHPVKVAPLRFTDWLRLIPASLTPEYWRGELSPEVALPFYFEALDRAMAELEIEWPGRKVQLVGHSIGGWIARAYLGQLDPAVRARRVSALATLGTPHTPPPEGFFRTIDQTRGLLAYVEKRYPGAFHPELRYLTVGSRAVSSAGGLRLPSCGESLGRTLALASYLPLCGQGDTDGDGITPICCAHLDGAEQREVEAFHIAFVPGSGTRLLGTPWYGSPQLVARWADFLK